MKRTNRMLALALGAGLIMAAPGAWAQHEHEGGQMGGGQRGGGHPAEPERGPQHYQPMQRPQGAEARPQQMNRQDYNHNFTASRGYHIGPYHAPSGFSYHRWGYGDVLPRAYWGQDYWLSDYWLFGLEVPPVGYEWVRYGPDAVLIDTNTGEVIQVVYGRFL
jgi:Ni/Co efflux regulator RcnB